MLLSVLLLVILPSLAQSGQVYEVKKTRVIHIDGIPDNSWQRTGWSDSWNDIVTSQEGMYRTRFKSLWDAQNIYFLFEVIDPDITATIDIDHMPLFKYDNIVEVFLDPNGDQKNYYELQINAKGTRWELILDKPYKDGGEATSPNELEGLKYAIHHNGTINESDNPDHSWSLEVAIPWESLLDIEEVPPRSTFRANFSRVFQDDDDIDTSPQYWLWQPIGKPNIHIPDKWGRLVFLKE